MRKKNTLQAKRLREEENGEDNGRDLWNSQSFLSSVGERARAQQKREGERESDP